MAATAGLLSGQGMYAGEAPNNPSATHLTSIQSHTLTTANQQLRQILEGTLNSIGFLLKMGLVSEEEISSQLMISQTKIDNFLHWLEEEHNSTYIRDSDILKVEIKKIFENIQNIITSDNKQLKYDIKVLIDAFIKSISSIKTVQNWKGDGGEAFT